MNYFSKITLILGLTAGLAAQAADSIKIGTVNPLTGPQAHLGKDLENGIRLALDEVNASQPSIGGQPVQFELVSEDDQADPRIATIMAQKLVDSGVKGVLGHLNSGTTIPAARIYADAGLPQVSASATAVAYTQQGFKTTFRLMANDSQQGKALGEYAVKTGKRIALIDDRTAYGQGLADQVEKAIKASGGEVVAREYTTDKSTDFSAILTSIKAKKPDVVMFGGMDAQAAPMARQLKTLGLNAVFMGGDGVQTAEYLKLAGAAAEGTIGSIPGQPLDKMPGGPEFSKKFNARFGVIQLYAPFAYDAFKVFVDAMQRAGSAEPEKYLPMLASTKLQGVTGPIVFDERGDIKNGPVTLYQVKNGGWVVLETVGGK